MTRRRTIVSSRELDLLRRLLMERTEELERVNERLFLADQVKTDFLSHMSREFQRPLNHIVDFAQCLREEAMGPVTREQRICLDTIIARGKRLQRLLERVLSLCNDELGMALFLPRKFPVREVLDHVMDRLGGAAGKRGVELHACCGNDGCTIIADKGKFTFIIEELLTNALKFSDRGGRVDVAIDAVKRRGRGEELRITVSDQGKGIGSKELEQIFRSFEMGKRGRAEPGSLGIGLTLVKRFVELHGGTIAVESTPSVGSTFTVVLPRQGPAERGGPPPRVILADQAPERLRELTEALRQERCDIITAVDGRDALDKGIAQSPALCILALDLPGIDGIDVCSRLKAHEQSSQIPVIITAPHRDASVRSRCAQAGADGFFALPAEMGDLLMAARGLIARKLSYDFLKRNYEIAASEAFTDPLTGIFNLRQFWLSLDHELKRARRYRRNCSLAMIDIDWFKHYNDCHGHLRGDEVLREAAAVFRGCIRTSDIAARYGGEEFVVIMPETNRELALLAGEKLRRAVEEHPFPLRETQPGGALTVSIGIATFPDDAEEGRELVEAADRALYRAKEGGRNRVVAAAADGTD